LQSWGCAYRFVAFYSSRFYRDEEDGHALSSPSSSTAGCYVSQDGVFDLCGLGKNELKGRERGLPYSSYEEFRQNPG
jgi:hypothetical protein